MAGVGKGADLEPKLQVLARSVNHQLGVHRKKLDLLLDGLNELRQFVRLPGYGKGDKGKGWADSDLDDASSRDTEGDSRKGEGKFSGKGKGKFYRDRHDIRSCGSKGKGKFSSKGDDIGSGSQGEGKLRDFGKGCRVGGAKSEQ